MLGQSGVAGQDRIDDRAVDGFDLGCERAALRTRVGGQRGTVPHPHLHQHSQEHAQDRVGTEVGELGVKSPAAFQDLALRGRRVHL